MREDRPRSEHRPSSYQSQYLMHFITVNLRAIDSLPPPVTARLPNLISSILPSFHRITRSLHPKLNHDQIQNSNSNYSSLLAQSFTSLYSRILPATPNSKLSNSSRTNNATWLSMIWNTAPQHQRRSSHDSSTTPLDTLTTKFDHQRNRFALSRKGFLLVLFLLLLGLRDLLLRSSHHSTTVKDSAKLKIKGRDPFVVLQELAPAFVHPLGALLPFSKLWKQDPQTVETSLGRGDTTAIVLNWKRTENVVVIVASLCQYSFFETVLVWNNNPQLHLTREVSFFPSFPTQD